MPTVKAHYDGKVFIPDEPVHLQPGTQTEVFIPGPPTNATPQLASRPRVAGWLHGKAWIAPDFDSLSPTS